MRGETKICLFDAKTGKQVYEHIDHNMVTNAVSKLLSPKNEWVYGYTQNNLMGTLGYLFPLTTKAFGGVLLFNDTIDENEDMILPPPSANCVAYAGGEYAGTNSFRGTYNTNESGAITNGYRHVWDFGTDKGNGTINSVCLTSLQGGNAGWALPAVGDTSVATLTGLGNFTNPTSIWKLKRTYGKPLFMKATPDTGMLESITLLGTTLYRVKEANLSDLSLLSRLNVDYDSSTVRYTYEKIADLKAQPHAYTNPNTKMYYMDGKLHHVYPTTYVAACFSLTHDIYTLEGVIESSKTITTATSFYGSQGPSFYYKGKYFACTTASGTSLSVFSPDGTLEGTVDASKAPVINSGSGLNVCSVSYIPQCDRIVLTPGSTTNSVTKYSYMLGEDLSLSGFYTSADGIQAYSIVATEDNTLPYAILTTIENIAGQPSQYLTYLAYWSPYLATINNLATSVTKTNSHTMKIVYSIYDE